MPIRPIDIATVAPRSQEASVSHGNQIRHEEQMKQQAETQFSNQVQRDNRQTVETKKKWPDYAYEESGKKGGDQSRKKQKKKGKEEDKGRKPASESIFDIKI